MNPTISIIIPVYNVERYLSRCVDSVLSQTFSDFELLLVNDGSCDDSGSICDEYAQKDNRIKVFHKANGGVSSARNVGLDNAKGDFVLFIDSDDYVDKNHLENYMRSDADITYQGAKMLSSVDGNIEEIKELPVILGGGYQLQYVVYLLFKKQMVFGPTWSKMFKRSIIEENQIRFKEDISFREDEIFTFEYVAHAHNIALLPTVTYNYIHYPNSLMHRHVPYEELMRLKASYEDVALSYATDENLKHELENYYVQLLDMIGISIYYAKQLRPRSVRKQFLQEVRTVKKNINSSAASRFCIMNWWITDGICLLRRLISRLKFKYRHYPVWQ